MKIAILSMASFCVLSSILFVCTPSAPIEGVEWRACARCGKGFTSHGEALCRECRSR